jgi:hypothetical protein
MHLVAFKFIFLLIAVCQTQNIEYLGLLQEKLRSKKRTIKLSRTSGNMKNVKGDQNSLSKEERLLMLPTDFLGDIKLK